MRELYEKVVTTSGMTDAEKGMIVTESIHFYPVNGIILPDDATNGDVMRAMFPNLATEHNGVLVNVRIGDYCTQAFTYDWWTASYNAQEGAEE